MKIGLPKESKDQEWRMPLTPDAVRVVVERGHQVVVEAGAGVAIGFPDHDFTDAGATIGDPWAQEVVIKVKEPQPSEYSKLGQGQILFGFLHLAPIPKLTRHLMESGVTAVAFETVVEDGKLPLLQPMSEIAGQVAVQSGAYCLQMAQGGRGVLMGPDAKVVVIGGGVVGGAAVKVASALGADVALIDRSPDVLARFKRCTTHLSTPEVIFAEVVKADLVVGAALVRGGLAPQLITAEMVASMQKGAVIVDVAIDQGGCCATSHPTTHVKPTFVVDGIVHYCVANMPAACSRTATCRLSDALLPYLLDLADGKLYTNLALVAGINVDKGKITNEALARAYSASQ